MRIERSQYQEIKTILIETLGTFITVGIEHRFADSVAFASDYAGKGVSFKAMFIGEWTLIQPYQMGGISTKERVFINHRDTSYQATDAGFGSSDAMVPPFALSIEKAKSDIIYELKSGDIVEIRGLAQKANMPGKKGLHILIHEIRKVTQP